MNCLLIASLETNFMQSEVQELTNLLSAKYKVKLLQTGITSLELYRSLGTKLELVWIASHSSSAGFSFSDVVISPAELGMFLFQAKTEDLVLNSCFSSEHINVIQRYANVNIIATIQPDVLDREAWTSALYLGRELSNSDLHTAYNSVLVGGSTVYRWYPAPRMVRTTMDTELREILIRLDRLEDRMDRVTRAQIGDPEFKQEGIVDILKVLVNRVENIEKRMNSGNLMHVTRVMIITFITAFILLTAGIIYMIYLLGGYNALSYSADPLRMLDPLLFAGIY